MEKELELLRLKQQNCLLQAQSLERDVLVREHSRLMGEANEIQLIIVKMELKIKEEVRQNEINQSNPIYPPDSDPNAM